MNKSQIPSVCMENFKSTPNEELDSIKVHLTILFHIFLRNNPLSVEFCFIWKKIKNFCWKKIVHFISIEFHIFHAKHTHTHTLYMAGIEFFSSGRWMKITSNMQYGKMRRPYLQPTKQISSICGHGNERPISHCRLHFANASNLPYEHGKKWHLSGHMYCSFGRECDWIWPIPISQPHNNTLSANTNTTTTTSTNRVRVPMRIRIAKREKNAHSNTFSVPLTQMNKRAESTNGETWSEKVRVFVCISIRMYGDGRREVKLSKTQSLKNFIL